MQETSKSSEKGKNFRSDLVWLDEEFDSQEVFFHTISDRLYQKGLVKQEFGDALQKREKEFPTGLKTEFYEIAIPHTDVEYVEAAFIAFVRFKTPIPFDHMGVPGMNVNAKFAFVLGVKEPQMQVEALSTLVKLISDEEQMRSLEQMQSKEEISDVLNHFFDENM